MDQDEAASSRREAPSISSGRLTDLLAELVAVPPHDPAQLPAPEVGDRLGRFRLVRQIGHGGFGLVFEAEDTELRRRVALKVVRSQPSAPGASAPAEWLRQEAEAAARFRHPNVVTLYDAGNWSGRTCLVYELLEGQTLADRLSTGPLPRSESRRVIGEVARALEHLHAAGVVHRDLKATNVFLETGGAVKLLDLGLAQLAGSAGVAAGSPPYVAPEQWRGEGADSRADVYAWGVLAHQLIAGTLPDKEPLAWTSYRPSSLRALVAAARSADPEARPADGRALRIALDGIERRRSRGKLLRVAALVATLVAGAFLLSWPTERNVARRVTTTAEAYHRYAAGTRCMDRPSEGASWLQLDCARHFHQALQIDPDFPLAKFALAALARWNGRPRAELAQALESALRHAAQLPPRERAQLKAWKAELDGDRETAIRTLHRLAKEHPAHADVALALAEAYQRQGRHAEAIAPFERALALDPGMERASHGLVWSLGILDRRAALQDAARRMSASAPNGGTHHGEVRALGWLGDLEGALQVARHAALGGGGAAREDLEDALVAAGRLDEAEAMLRADIARGMEQAPLRLESLLLLRGRVQESRVVAEHQLAAPGIHPRLATARRAQRLAAERDAAALERLADDPRTWSVEAAATLAPALAYAGATARAEQLLPALAGEPGAQELARALITWRRGGARTAAHTLRRLARADPRSVPSMPPDALAWLAAECAAEAGPPETALVEIRRFQRFHDPLGQWRGWAYPRSIVLEARLLADLGRRAEAEAALDELRVAWASADPEHPLVEEAGALRQLIGDAGGAPVPQAAVVRRRPAPR